MVTLDMRVGKLEHNYFYGRTAEMVGIVAQCENARPRKAAQFQRITATFVQLTSSRYWVSSSKIDS
jgi:hypothetical protein